MNITATVCGPFLDLQSLRYLLEETQTLWCLLDTR